MTYINNRISDCVAYGFTGGPEFSTNIVLLDNGRELRNAQWMYPRHRYSADYANLLPDAKDQLLAAFHAARGRWAAFRFKDWNDYVAVNQALSVNVGTQDPVQLVKRYFLGGAFAERRIAAVVSAVVTGPSGQVTGTVDNVTGMFTPAANWEAGSHTWSGEFDVWVRFDSDFNSFVIGSGNADGHLHSASIDLVEDKSI